MGISQASSSDALAAAPSGATIRTDTANEYIEAGEKVAPVAADRILAEDSADSNNKVFVQVGNLPAAAPAAHANSHVTGGADKIRDAAAVQDGLMTAAFAAKLDGIEAGATADQTAGEIEAVVSHDNLQGVSAAEHLDWTADQGATNIDDANIAQAGVTQHEGAIDHDALTNFVAAEHTPFTADVAASRPAAGIAGRYFFATDTTTLSRDNGATWDDMGGVTAAQSSLISSIDGLNDGAYIDSPAIAVASDGATITLTFEKSGGGDVRLRIGNVTYTMDCTPAQTISLAAGTDTVFTESWVWIEIIGGVPTLQTNTTWWPAATALAPVGRIVCQSAATLQTKGAHKVHAYTDHISDGYTGHLAHNNAWIRQQPATWMSGVTPVWTITANGGAPDNVDIATAAGVVLQLHNHTFPEFDTSVASSVFVANDSAVPYTEVTDLNALLTDANGVSMSGKYFNIVLWGIVSEDTSDCKLYVNLPTGMYTSDDRAEADVDRTAVYAIPSWARGCGFLVSRIVLRHQNAASGTWTSVSEQTLLGLNPANVAGGSLPQSPEFSDATFRINDNADATKQVAVEASAITTATTRTITMPDADIRLGGLPYFSVDRGATKLRDSAFLYAPLTQHMQTGTQFSRDLMGNVDLRANGTFPWTNIAHINPGSASRFTGTEYYYAASAAWLANGVDGSNGNTNSFWVGIWCRMDALAARVMVSHHTATGNQRGWDLDFDGTDFRFFTYSDGTGASVVIAKTAKAIAIDTWYYVHGFYDASAQLIGVGVNADAEVTTAQTAGVHASTSQFQVGGVASSGSWVGYLSDLIYCKTGRPSTENIEDLYAGGVGQRMRAA